MRYCFNCRSITPGRPRFCNACGRSYDVKLCPRFHSNPVEARVCAECGSQVLSTPQPRRSWWIRPLKLFGTFLPGAGLLMLSGLYFAAYVWMLAARPDLQFRFMLGGLALSALWLVYMELSASRRSRPPRR